MALRMKRAFEIALLLGSALSVVSSLAAQETYPLHAAFALTGVGASFGAVEVEGSTLAIEDFNQRDTIDGKKVVLTVEDTQSDNVHTLSAIRKLISIEHADTILGPTWLDSYQSVLPISDEKRILLFTASGATVVFKKSSSDFPYAFSTWFNLEREVEQLLAHVHAQGHRKLLLTFDQDPFFQSIRTLIQKRAPQLGMTIVSDDSFNLQGAEFRSVLTRARSAEADAAIFGFGDESNLLTFLKQRIEIYPSLPLYGTDYVEGYVAQRQWLSRFENVDYITSAVHDMEFIARYQKRFGHGPVLSAATAYDATAMLLQAFKAGKRDPASIRSYLLSNEFASVTFGNVRFNNSGGVDKSEFVIKRVRNGKVAVNN